MPLDAYADRRHVYATDRRRGRLGKVEHFRHGRDTLDDGGIRLHNPTGFAGKHWLINGIIIINDS
jgi:hypothetical protein